MSTGGVCVCFHVSIESALNTREKNSYKIQALEKGSAFSLIIRQFGFVIIRSQISALKIFSVLIS